MLLGRLVAKEMTRSDAVGLSQSWRPHSFVTAGKRCLLFMTIYDYDELCPLEIEPRPTEVVRVGILMTEF